MPSTDATINAYGPLFEGVKVVSPAIKRAAEKARRFGILHLKTISPVRTGFYRSRWAAQLEGYGIRYTNDAPYAIYLEMGTRKMRARRVLGRTLPEVDRVFRKELSREVGSALAAKTIGDVPISPITWKGTSSSGTSAATRVFNQLTKPTPVNKGFKGYGTLSGKKTGINAVAKKGAPV